MKEILLRLADEIADYLSNDARGLGITSEDLIGYIVGTYVQDGMRMHVSTAPLMYIMKGNMSKLIREGLKRRVRAGEVKCENCTMKLTEKDIDDEKCGSCGAPLREALGG